MMMHRASLVVLIVLTQVAAGQDAVWLRVRYEPETEWRIDSEQELDQQLLVAGQKLKSGSQTQRTTIVSLSPRNPDGTIRQTVEVKRIRSILKLQNGARLEFDSADPRATRTRGVPNGDQIVAAMLLPLKLKRTYIYDREGKLLNAEVSGLDLARLSPGMQGQFTPETLRRQRIQELSLLPDKPVQPGDTWQRTTEIELGAGQALQVVTDYSYRGLRDRDGAQLDLLVSEIRSVDFLLKPGAPLPLKITDSNVKPVNSSGQVWFDREAGQIVAASNRLQALGTLTLSSGGMSIEGKIDLTILTNSAARPKSDDDDEGDPAADGDSSDSRGNKAGGDAGSRG